MRMVPMDIKRHLVFDGPFAVKGNGGSFQLVNGSGFEIEALIFWEGIDSFETQSMRIWKRLCLRATHIFDVGANTGIYSLVARSVSPHAHVYAFEPIQRVFAILEENCRLNGHGDPESRVRCFRLALSDYSGDGEMYDLPTEHIYTASLNRNVHQERGQSMQAVTESVPVMRLDDFLSRNSIKGLDLMKIDVESHEPNVIRGLGSALLERHPAMIVEIWNSEVGTEVEKALEGCSYRFYAIRDDGLELTPHVRNDQPESGYVNYLICSCATAAELDLT